MRIPKSIQDNLHFLIGEVASQVTSLQSYFENPSPSVAKRILDRSGYAYNLKMRIHDSCLSQIGCHKGGDNDTLFLRGLESTATDLERITELCRECVHQMGHLKKRRFLSKDSYVSQLKRIVVGIELIERAIYDNETELALKIGRIEQKIDLAYNKLLKRYTRELKRKKETEDLVSALFVAHSVEQMGDALLKISESIISTNLGQPVNTDRYQSMRESVEQFSNKDISDLVIKPIAETRSGSGISGIRNPKKKKGAYVAIFKDGKKEKLKEEREGVESWHEIFPGLAPKILSYNKRGQSASLLIEHLPGLTFEQILLHEPQKLLDKTLKQLGKTLESIWRETRTKKPVSAHYIQQLVKRLDEVYTIHPEFRQSDSNICGLKVLSFDSLLKQAEAYEKKLEAPFSVYIHGDFNVDNIIYDAVEKHINFIDLHRSRYMDYVQDISVFMVSNYRLQVLDRPLRRRIMEVAQEFHRFASAYANKRGDETFELRLALGLARSFATSTRFILDKSLARTMFLRARYLIEQVIATDPKKADKFRIPIKEIFVG